MSESTTCPVCLAEVCWQANPFSALCESCGSLHTVTEEGDTITILEEDLY
tara:strand:+ start:807 stop:956 length:150 start_codon:yes stop_codon:yes gene_type:complete